MLAIVLALSAALSWGGGDFAGGLASRRASPRGVALYSLALGLLLLLPLALLIPQPATPWWGWAWSAAAGAIGGLGILCLYTSLAAGRFGIAAPVSGVAGAALPVVVGALAEGLPRPAVLAGLGLALVAVGLLSWSGGRLRNGRGRLADLRLPLLAGLLFGLYFVLMHEGSRESVLWPLVAARAAGLVTLLLSTVIGRQWPRPAAFPWPLLALSAVLDTGGNALYILAGQVGRLDVAAVLSSLYPGVTVLLAWLLLREKVSPLQAIGVLTALAAIVLLTI